MDLKIYAENLESQAMNQINALDEIPIFDEVPVRIMPDAHAGAGCVIGFTAPMPQYAVPNLVGVDIHCGILTRKLTKPVTDFEALDAAVHAVVPTGFNVHNEINNDVESLGLRCIDKMTHLERLNRSIGTLGGGKIDCLRAA